METDPDSPEFNNKVIAEQAVEIRQKDSLISNITEAYTELQRDNEKLRKTIEGQGKTISYLSLKLNKVKFGWGVKLQQQVESALATTKEVFASVKS